MRIVFEQDFVNRFGSSVYGKYEIYELANAYRAVGDDAKAQRE